MPLTNYQERKLNYVVKKPLGDLEHTNTRRQTRALEPNSFQKKSKETLGKYDENSSLF